MENILFDFLSQHISLSEEEKMSLISLNIFRACKKRTILLKEGQRSLEGYFVLKGCLRTFYIIDGEEKTTEFYTEMDVITPNCVVDKKPSKYYVACVEDSILTISNPGMEEEIFRKFPKFETLCRILSEQLLAKKQNSFDSFKTSSPEERYLNLLESRPDLLNRVPQRHLASYLGIILQSLSRLRARIFEKVKN